jgi:Sulfotransferase family
MHASRPNLFIIGAMKSGTTTLHNYLNCHPDIAMSDEKEPGYFVEELGFHHGEAWYLNLFDPNPRYKYRGESSTHYTKLPLYKGVAERIHRFNPNAKLIYIMRDPFQRLISHYWHAVRDIHSGGELRPLIKAVQSRPDYIAFSNYAEQLAPYIHKFGRDAIHTLTFESLIKNPQAELDAIYDWLEVDRHSIAASEQRADNQKPETIVGVAGTGVLNRIQYSSAWDKLSKLVPQGVKNLAKQAAYREVDESGMEQDTEELRRIVRATQMRQVDALQVLLGRDFPDWTIRA